MLHLWGGEEEESDSTPTISILHVFVRIVKQMSPPRVTHLWNSAWASHFSFSSTSRAWRCAPGWPACCYGGWVECGPPSPGNQILAPSAGPQGLLQLLSKKKKGGMGEVQYVWGTATHWHRQNTRMIPNWSINIYIDLYKILYIPQHCDWKREHMPVKVMFTMSAKCSKNSQLSPFPHLTSETGNVVWLPKG